MKISPPTSLKQLLDLNLISVRAFNVCSARDLSLRTAGDIKKFVDAGNSFLDLKNCGRKSATELLNVAKLVELTQEHSKEEQASKEVIDDYFSSLDAELRQIFIDEYELLINDPSKDIKIIEAFRTIFPSPSYLYDIRNHVNILKDKRNIVELDARYQYFIYKEIHSILNEIRRQIVKKLTLIIPVVQILFHM